MEVNSNSQQKSVFSVRIAPGAVVCDECELQGEITIGKLRNYQW